MADRIVPVASAVILPPDAPKSPRNKRRQSSASASDTASKRPKFSPNGRSNSPSTIRASPPIETIKDDPSANAEPRSPTIDRRKSSVQEEKKRGQRLFGGLLSTLSQSTPNGQQKRRLEIEKRQKERAAQQKAEDRAEKAEKLANLKAIRKIEQVKFDEQSMRTRHSNMLAMANFLVTKSEPKLYYKPWELLPEEEERIKIQVSDVEALIEREVEEWNKRHPKEASEKEEATKVTSKQTVGEPQAESPSISNVIDTTNSVHVQEATQSDQGRAEKEESMEEHNEVVVVAEEDTVIY